MTRPSGFFQTLEKFCAVFPIIGKILSLCMIAAATARANPGDSFTGWAVGMTDGSTPNILCTTNGRNWFQQGAGQVPAINITGVAAVGTKVWVVGEADGGYASIYHSDDDGATWTRQGDAGTLPDVEMGKCWAVNDQIVWTVGYSGTVLRTTNGGAEWQNVSVPFSSNMFQAVTAVDADIAWVSGEPDPLVGFAGLFHTTNGGVDWTQQTVGGVTNVDHILGLAAVDSQVVWGIGGGHQDIILTTNAGALWETKYRGAANRDGNEICVAPDGSVWGATDSTIFWSTNNGADWNTANVADFTMDVDSPDGTNIWAVRQNYDGGIIYFSSDAGATWTQQVSGGVRGLQTVTMQKRAKTYPAGTRFVWTNSPSPTPPYTNWHTAAQTLQAAVDIAETGDTVLAHDGSYESGGRCAPGSTLTNRVCITNAITLQSVHGAARTFIRGQSDNGTNGPAAIRCAYVSSNAVVRGFTLEGGYTSSAGDWMREMGGGGALVLGQGKIESCIIRSNSAGYGGGLFLGVAIAENCLIIRNNAKDGGGVLFSLDGSIAKFCTIADNTASGFAGGIYGQNSPESTSYATNCIVYFNNAQTASNIIFARYLSTCTAPANPGSGNISLDPCFLDRDASNYRLRYGSPCIDSAGSATATNDLDVTARPLDGNYDDSSDFDMGCYEYNPATADSNQDGVPDWWYHGYSLNPTSLTVAIEDDDKDTFNNKAEWIALTSPTDSNSYFLVADIRRSNSMSVVFNGSPQRVYSLQSSADFSDNSWLPVDGATNQPGTGAATTLTDMNAASLKAYRVEVSLP